MKSLDLSLVMLILFNKNLLHLSLIFVLKKNISVIAISPLNRSVLCVDRAPKDTDFLNCTF